jgi:hypothetical protein
MSDGVEAAKEQRNLLERLGDKIPGYRGFQNRELRRDVDRLLREHLAGEVGRSKASLQSKVRDYTDAGRLTALNGFVRLDRQLDGLSQTIRFSDYGASGLFDPVKIGEPALERLYQFDLSVLDDGAIAAIPAASSGAASADAAASLDGTVEKVRDLVHALDDKWKQRRQVISSAVESGQSA